MTPTPTPTPALTRRTALRTLAASLAVGTAGCLGEADPTKPLTTTTPDPGPFERVTLDGFTITVQVAESAGIAQINAIQPDGTLFGTRQFATGVTRVEFTLRNPYLPGEYRLIALDDRGPTGETTLHITPDLRILEVGFGANNLDRMPDELNFNESEIMVRIENRGSGPAIVGSLRINGDVPNPSDDSGRGGTSGIFDEEAGWGDSSGIVIDAGATVVIYSTTMPFLFVPSKFDCESNQEPRRFEVAVRERILSEVLVKEYLAHYGSTIDNSGCAVTIEPEVQ